MRQLLVKSKYGLMAKRLCPPMDEQSSVQVIAQLHTAVPRTFGEVTGMELRQLSLANSGSPSITPQISGRSVIL